MKITPAHILFPLISAGLIAPIAFYAYHFGTAVSTSHTRWAEMGSAIAGMYAPLIGGLTLMVLWMQLRTQSKQAEFIAMQHIHNDTMTRARFMLDKIERVIESKRLHDKVTWLNKHSLDELVDARATYDGSEENLRTLAFLWQNFNAIFSVLSDIDDIYLKLTATSIRNLAMTQLGPPACISLDAMAFVAGKDMDYFFRDELNSVAKQNATPEHTAAST